MNTHDEQSICFLLVPLKEGRYTEILYTYDIFKKKFLQNAYSTHTKVQ